MAFVTQILFYLVSTTFLRVFMSLDRSVMPSEPGSLDSKELNPRKNLEEEYLDYEAKVQSDYLHNMSLLLE